MRRSLARGFLLAVLLGTTGTGTLGAGEDAHVLFEIGKADNDTADLALGPGAYAKWKSREDPVFIVGVSDPREEWPYVHPGPADAWAGSKQHTFTVLFGLEKLPPGAACRLAVDLVDTHDRSPSKLEITLNGRKLTTHQTPPGGPDDSVLGDPSKGREHRFEVELPADALAPGTNELSIRTLSGSWVLYDAVALTGTAGVKTAPVAEATLVYGVECPSVLEAPALLAGEQERQTQAVRMKVRHVGPAAAATLSAEGAKPLEVELKPGVQTLSLPVPAVEEQTPVTVDLRVGEKTIASRRVVVEPVRRWTVYLLPHSHVDIGYTQLQSKVEADHWRFYEQAIEAARRTADYPAGCQFKWNVEVLWATDSYLRQASPEKQQEFVEAVQKGWIGFDALYGNELTALCRPEELARLVDYSQRLSERCGVAIDSAMITDVPGYTWGLTTVLGEAGVKYLSMGPNSSARIGFTHTAWDEKPFWWINPSRRHKVLCWIPRGGYYRTFRGEKELLDHLKWLAQQGYPYDLVQLRYCLGDNAGPGIELAEKVKAWNAKYAYPKLVIATTHELFAEFERRYGDGLPEFYGDFTPYWEDGAASSARETAINRASAERLGQAEAIFAMADPKAYPDEAFYAAWRNVLLYDEHTWGAHNSIREPDSEFAKAQWAVKQAFALDGARQSRELMAAATARLAKRAPGDVKSVLVVNTSSWARTDLALLPEQAAAPGTRVTDAGGKPVPSQRLSCGRLAFLATDVPPLGAKRYDLSPGDPPREGKAKAEPPRLSTGTLTVAIDEKTGAVASLRRAGIDAELVDGAEELGLNDYFYVAGTDPAGAKRNGPVTISVKDAGPLVASLAVECDAPGCRKLTREVRVVDGLGRVELTNVVDKEAIRTKEGVHFAFPFRVPDGVMRMDLPWAVARPEADQIPGSCKNWFTVQRWIDTSNDRYGVTWTTVDAPLVEVGTITAETPWIKTLEPTQTLYSYVMNNYWFTNYKADQEGPTTFRYALRPHPGGYDAVEAARFGIEQSQALVAAACSPDAPEVIPSLVTLDRPEVIVGALKPSRDGRALIVRLFGVGGKKTPVTLTWREPKPKAVFLSDLSEKPGMPVHGPIEVPANGLVTLRAERAE